MDLDRPHFRTTSTGSSTTTTAAATTSELFICFTSRLSSSSSMKLTKSILSPGRAARDGGGPVSLSSSLSRRLRTNGSLKGGASPFFTTTGKKRGCAFENPEPSSPKVTCIGQVRVKTKKKVKQSRSLSKTRSGEVSFRKIEQGSGDGGGHHQNEQQRYSNASGAHYQQQQQQPQECLPHRSQRWVHLPISICEALSCLFPCKNSCFSTSGETEKTDEKHQNGSENGCGAVLTRWLVSVNDGEGGKRREIELVVGGGDEAEERVSMRSSRRHVFEDIEVKDDRIEVKGKNVDDGGEEEAARVSICIPPKNALLLMRCRSDPMKMADLGTRFSWDAHAALKTENEDIEEEEEGEEEENEVISEEQDVAVVQQCEGKDEVLDLEDVAVLMESNEEDQEIVVEAETNMEMEVGDIVKGDDIEEEEIVIISSEKSVEEKELEELQQELLGNLETFFEEEDEKDDEDEVESNMSSFEDLLDQENVEDCPIQDKEEVGDNSICHLSPSTESDEENVESNEAANGEETEAIEEESNIPEKVAVLVNDGEEFQVKLEPETIHTANGERVTIHTANGEQEEEEEQTTVILPTESEMVDNLENQEPVTSIEEPKKKAKDRSQVLPECLLLMMCEPKLSMEVSKETWVCSTDFVRWLPERPRKHAKPTTKAGGGCDHAPIKRRLSVDSKLKPITTHRAAAIVENGYQQPPRSSCSLPTAAAAASMATMIEQKLVNAVGYEPFVLTRCKSEPMKTAAAKLLPESCFWKNAVRKLEPHRQATLGVGAAGVGF